MSMQVFNARRRVVETLTPKACAGNNCTQQFMGRSYETLCPRCEHKRMAENIKQATKSDDWTAIQGGHMRKNHLGGQDR